MNLKISHAPTLAYCGLGALASVAIFNKLSHMAEYILNKRFGDYNHLRRTSEGEIIVAFPRYRDHYFLQNITLATFTATVSSLAT